MANKQQLTLAVEMRDKSGTTAAHKLRVAGKVPGVIYGHGTAPEHVAFEARALDDVLHHGGRTGLISLKIGNKTETALVRELQRDPLSRKVIHADLLRVSADESVHAKLPIATVGVARGVREAGGVMDVIFHEIEVEGPADRLPERLEVDVTELGIHEHASASDVVLPDGFKLITPADTTIITIEASKTAQAVEDAATGPTLEVAEPELIGGKPEAPESAS
ncbi:MAG TPA: 50S ribosomal protein L25 [Candidatus Baltobacteraceae bacterium]